VLESLRENRVDLLLSSCPGPRSSEELESSVALLARARAGDRGALGDLVARYQEPLLRVVRIRLGPGMRRWLESGDIVQETYQALLRDLGRLDVEHGDELVQWLAQVATNRIRDQHDRMRAQKRDPEREHALEADAASQSAPAAGLAAADTSPPSGAMRAEVREILDEAIASLSEEYREAILLRDFCGAAWEHVARELGRESVHAAQQLHQRAWIKVRRLAEPRLRGMSSGGK
jgi:RNA polymerase sigma-70 factor, ECF subfamily